MKLFAISDLHINHEANRAAVEDLPPHPNDWLILCGDCCDSYNDLKWLLETLKPKWAKLIWVPGNHELWTRPDDECQKKGVARYEALVSLCRQQGVLTPEDPYQKWPGSDTPIWLIPMFLLYDYSFSPPGLSPQQAIAWAAESGIRCTDETYLFKEPHEDAAQWCRARLESTQQRLATIPAKEATVLINHFPLKADLVRLFKIPRFSPWCGTTATESWHIRYRAKVVVSGHLHMRATDWRGPCRFEEVSVGYPKHWHQEKTMNFYLREILPGPPNTDTYPSKPQWRF